MEGPRQEYVTKRDHHINAGATRESKGPTRRRGPARHSGPTRKQRAEESGLQHGIEGNGTHPTTEPLGASLACTRVRPCMRVLRQSRRTHKNPPTHHRTLAHTWARAHTHRTRKAMRCGTRHVAPRQSAGQGQRREGALWVGSGHRPSRAASSRPAWAQHLHPPLPAWEGSDPRLSRAASSSPHLCLLFAVGSGHLESRASSSPRRLLRRCRLLHPFSVGSDRCPSRAASSLQWLARRCWTHLSLVDSDPRPSRAAFEPARPHRRRRPSAAGSGQLGPSSGGSDHRPSHVVT